MMHFILFLAGLITFISIGLFIDVIHDLLEKPRVLDLKDVPKSTSSPQIVEVIEGADENDLVLPNTK